MEILSKINQEDSSTVIVSLHQVDIALKYCKRVVALHQGKVVYDGLASQLTPQLLQELYGVHVTDLLPTPPACMAANLTNQASQGSTIAFSHAA